jgi:hypothetical protein
MAKMFYDLSEAAKRLGKGEEEVKAMADSGQLEVFRDRDRLMFKVSQIDLMSGGKADDDIIPLAADSGELEPISLASSGSAIALAGDNIKEQTGISIFDADATDDSDPSAVTRVTPTSSLGATVGSSRTGSGMGDSGMMDITREGSGMGAGLDDIYTGGSDGTGAGADVGAMAGGGLFEGGSAVEPAASPLMMAMAESYDGAGSGLVGGFAIGIVVTLGVTIFAVLLGITGAAGDILQAMGSQLWIWVGALAGITLVSGVVGWVLGKRS